MLPFASVLGDFVVGSIIVLFYFGVIVAWGFGLFDLFARKDLQGWQKALWLLAMIAAPLLGVAVYFVLRPKTARWTGSEIFDEPGEVNAPMPYTELEKLSALHGQGTLSDEEYERMKERLQAA
jgi:hypothetical protein